VFTVLGRGRGLFWGRLHFAGRLMPLRSLPRRDTELVILRVATLRQCDYELEHHRPLARRAGLDRTEVDRVADGPGLGRLDRPTAGAAAGDRRAGDDQGRLGQHLGRLTR